MALRNLLVRVGADISGLRQGLKNASKEVKYFGRNVTGSMKEIQGSIAKTAAALGAGLLVKSGIQDAMRYEALMTTLGETLGSSRKDFEKWQDTTGTAMGFSMVQGAELANMLSLNFKSIATDTADLTKKTTDMMELAAVISNKRGMAMTEVSDRIRSAMNQEADGAQELGVDVRIAAIKAGESYRMMADGAPWDQLSENMRKTILYHHIFEQVNKNLGMTMQDTTAMRMAQFTAVLANVRMALGQAFLPIVYSVLPLLTKMAQALFRVLQVVAAFMRALFGGGFKYKPPVTGGDVKNTQAQAAALGDMGGAADKAGKKAEGAGKKSKKAADKAKKAWSGTFGFDEVHTIKDPETPAPAAAAGAGAGAGGAGGGGLGGLGDAMDMGAPFEAFEQGLDAMTEKFRKFLAPIKEVAAKVWGAISSFAIEKFNQISAWWDEHGTQITQAIKNVWAVISPIITVVVKFIWESVKGLIDGVITFFQGLIEFFTGVFTGDWKMAWEGCKKIFFGAFQAVWNFFNLTFIGGIRKALLNFTVYGVKLIKGFSDDFIKFFKNIWTNIWNGLKSLGRNIKQIINDIWSWWVEFFIKVALRWADFAKKVTNAGKAAWEGIKSAFKGAADWFGRTIISPIVNKFKEIKNAFKEGIGSGLKAVFNLMTTPLNEMIGGLNKIKNAIPGIKALPNIPKVPRLAEGGIATGATLAMVGEGRQHEAIAPLDKLQGFITNAVRSAGGGGGTTGDIILNIDGRTFARIVKPLLDREQNRVGTDVRIRTI